MVYLPIEFRTQFAAQDWLRKYCSNEQTAKGRAALIGFAENQNIPTSTLVDIVNAPCKGPMQGLATSVLVQREILGTYKGPIRVDAPWAGSYITINRDHWGRKLQFTGEHVLTGADVKGDSALNLATLIGPRAGYKLRVAGDLSCQGLRVQGYQAGMDMRISGRGAGAAAYFKGTYAGYNVRFGDKSGRSVTFDGLGAGKNIQFDNLRDRCQLRYINNE